MVLIRNKPHWIQWCLHSGKWIRDCNLRCTLRWRNSSLFELLWHGLCKLFSSDHTIHRRLWTSTTLVWAYAWPFWCNDSLLEVGWSYSCTNGREIAFNKVNLGCDEIGSFLTLWLYTWIPYKGKTKANQSQKVSQSPSYRMHALISSY